ncbi:hypothetical protein KFE25_007116 [Diacronema lutheri]|uniref:Uncharacterized protein n=1 Tax=Diacronema lutheri TaxID=2081491 RepID=A0A8J5XXE1_DIALT|nr:hypothetical protein KFE25_007116 [Diacronema lutheri]
MAAARGMSRASAHLVLGWSAKQARILTGGGRAEQLYSAERGFPFAPDELPHHHMLNGTTHALFREWLASGRTCERFVGVWSRPLFTNGWEESTDVDEAAFNVQTRGAFIDLRVPTARPSLGSAGSLDALAAEELRLLARQHVFCGYTLPVSAAPGAPLVCTRHHAIDWNFVGVPRARPNKWRVEMPPPGLRLGPSTAQGASGAAAAAWKEWSFALDDAGQSYYMERWARVDGDGDGAGPTLALRSCSQPDEFIVLVGDHFAFARARAGCPLLPPARADGAAPPPASLVEMVDGAVARGDLATARSWLGLAGGHGRVSAGWRIDLCTHPWLEGTQLLRSDMVAGAIVDGHAAGEVHADLRAQALVHGADNVVVIGGRPWELLDRTGLRGAEDVLHVLRA